MATVRIAAFLVITSVIPLEAIQPIQISGRITDETGAPVPNAILRCSSTNHRGELTIPLDADGRFAFSAASHNEYEIYKVGPAVPPTFTEIGKIVAAGVDELDLGKIVLKFPAKREPVVELEGQVSSGNSTRQSSAIAALFVGAGGTAYLIDSEGKIFQLPRETDQVDYSSLQISEDRRSAGWLAEFPFCCTSYPIPLALVVYRAGEALRRFTGDGRAIFDWKFVRGGRQVAYYQAFLHGPPAQHYELRHVESERLIDKWDGALDRKAPNWTNGMQQ